MMLTTGHYLAERGWRRWPQEDESKPDLWVKPRTDGIAVGLPRVTEERALESQLNTDIALLKFVLERRGSEVAKEIARLLVTEHGDKLRGL